MPDQSKITNIILFLDFFDQILEVPRRDQVVTEGNLIFHAKLFRQDLGRIPGSHIWTGKNHIKIKPKFVESFHNLFELFASGAGERTLAVILVAGSPARDSNCMADNI